MRHRYHLTQALECIESFLEFNTENEREVDLAILAQKLRTAMRAIGKITGEVGVEDVLDVIFKDFCIGK